MKFKIVIAIMALLTSLRVESQPTSCDILQYAEEIRQMHTTPELAAAQLNKMHGYNFWYSIDENAKTVTYYISVGGGVNVEFFKEFKVA